MELLNKACGIWQSLMVGVGADMLVLIVLFGQSFTFLRCHH